MELLIRSQKKSFSLTDEKVEAGEGDESRAGNGEEEAGRVHQGHRGVAIEQHEKYERPQVLTGDISLRPKYEENDDTQTGGQAIHHGVPEEHRNPVHGGRHSGHKVKVFDVPHSLLVMRGQSRPPTEFSVSPQCDEPQSWREQNSWQK